MFFSWPQNMLGLDGKAQQDPVVLNHAKSITRQSYDFRRDVALTVWELCVCVYVSACMYHWDVSEIPVLGEFWGSRLKNVPVSSPFSVTCNLTRPDCQVDDDQTYAGDCTYLAVHEVLSGDSFWLLYNVYWYFQSDTTQSLRSFIVWQLVSTSGIGLHVACYARTRT